LIIAPGRRVETMHREAGMADEKRQRIIRLEATNVKRLRAVTIEPGGALTIVGGKNAAGKSSVLDSIAMALGGARAACERPVRDGADKGVIVCELDDYTVRRSFTAAGGGQLTVRARNGADVKSPQKFLDRFMADVSFDPLAFSRMAPKEQGEALRRLVKLDLSDVDSERERVYAERTDVNREVKRLSAKAEGQQTIPTDVVVRQSAAEINRQLEQARQTNADNAEIRRHLEAVKQSHELQTRRRQEAQQRVAELEQRLAAAKNTLAECVELVSVAGAAVFEVQSEVDQLEDVRTEPLLEQLEQLDENNRAVDHNERVLQLRADLEAEQDKADQLTKKLDELVAERERRIAEAKIPVRGLSFGDGGVTFNGLPFSQASAAEQLEVSVAMGIALNPTLRVMLIRDGSLLDDDSLAMVRAMAERNDFQVWLERVGDNDQAAIVIEDGEVKGE